MELSFRHPQNRPAKSTVKVTLKHGPRRSLSKLRTLLKANKYRTDLHQVSVTRADVEGGGGGAFLCS